MEILSDSSEGSSQDWDRWLFSYYPLSGTSCQIAAGKPRPPPSVRKTPKLENDGILWLEETHSHTLEMIEIYVCHNNYG